MKILMEDSVSHTEVSLKYEYAFLYIGITSKTWFVLDMFKIEMDASPTS